MSYMYITTVALISFSLHGQCTLVEFVSLVNNLSTNKQNLLTPIYFSLSPNIPLSLATVLTNPPEEQKNLLKIKLQNIIATSPCQHTQLTLLMQAAQDNDSTRINQLLQDRNIASAIDAQDENGNTALFYAIQYHDYIKADNSVLTTLLNHGANPNKANNNKETPLLFLIKQPSSINTIYNHHLIDQMRILIEKGAQINAQDADGNTPLIYAIIYHGNQMHGWDIVEDLLEKKADITLKNKQSKTALDYAYAGDRSNPAVIIIINSLKNYNKNQTETAPTLTPLMEAAKEDNIDAINQLLKQGAKINEQNQQGETALLYAAQQGKEKALKALLRADADPNIADNHGKTPLMFYTLNLAMVHLLVKNGATINIMDDDGDSVIYTKIIDVLATRPDIVKDKIAIVQYLFDQGARLHPAYYPAIILYLFARRSTVAKELKPLLEKHGIPTVA